MGRAAELVLAAVGVALLALALASCAGRVNDRPGDSAADALSETRWCVLATVGRHRVVACTDEYEVCAAWRQRAREKGRWVGVTSMSSCEPVEGRMER